MIITINEFLDLPVERDNIIADHEYWTDKQEMLAGNTKIIQGNEIKQRKWTFLTDGLGLEEAQTAVGILANLGDFWGFNGNIYSGKGQRPVFETNEPDPSEPLFVTGAYTSALRLNDFDMSLRVYLEPMYILSFYRQLVEYDDRFYHYLLDGVTDRIWIDGELASESEISDHEINDWLEVNVMGNAVEFDSSAGDIDEVYVMSGVSYTENLFSAEDVFEMGQLPMNGIFQHVQGDFLDSDESHVEGEIFVNETQWENIGESSQIEFRLEEKI